MWCHGWVPFRALHAVLETAPAHRCAPAPLLLLHAMPRPPIPSPPSNCLAPQGLIIVAIFLPPLAVFIHENACNSRVRFKQAPLAAASGPAAMLRTPFKPLVCTPSQRQ